MRGISWAPSAPWSKKKAPKKVDLITFLGAFFVEMGGSKNGSNDISKDLAEAIKQTDLKD